MEFSNFPAILVLHEINFGWFQKVKNCLFNYFGGFEFWFWEKFYIWAVKNSKFRTAQMVKMAVFGASKWPTLISHKIWVAEKSSISTLCILNYAAQICTFSYFHNLGSNVQPTEFHHTQSTYTVSSSSASSSPFKALLSTPFRKKKKKQSKIKRACL